MEPFGLHLEQVAQAAEVDPEHRDAGGVGQGHQTEEGPVATAPRASRPIPSISIRHGCATWRSPRTATRLRRPLEQLGIVSRSVTCAGYPSSSSSTTTTCCTTRTRLISTCSRPPSRRRTSAQWGVGATVYFGSEGSIRQLEEVTAAFAEAHRLGLVHRAVVLPAQRRLQDQGRRLPRQRGPHRDRRTTSASRLRADIIKQKQPENNGAYNAGQVR